MKAQLLLTIAFFCSIPLIQAQHTVDLDDLIEIDEVLYEVDAKEGFTGIAVSYYDNFQKEVEINYVDGIKEGLSTFWYESGAKEATSYWKEGKRNGMVTRFYEKVRRDGGRNCVCAQPYANPLLLGN